MSPPQAVVFDLGKVLVDFDYRIAAARLQPRCQRSVGELLCLLDQSPLLYRYETGLMTTEQFFAEVQARTGFLDDLPQFGEIFGDIFTPIAPMVDLHGTLRRAGVPTYLFSNTNELAVRNVRQKFPFFRHFDGHILSYEHGAMKPDPRLYEVVEHCAHHRGSELLYIDDRPENVAAGAQRGWQAILHETPGLTLAAVREAGLLRD